jgi:hypothetical protein
MKLTPSLQRFSKCLTTGLDPLRKSVSRSVNNEIMRFTTVEGFTSPIMPCFISMFYNNTTILQSLAIVARPKPLKS